MVLHFGWDPLSMCIAGAEILQISILAKASYDPRDRDNSWRCTLHNTNCLLYTLRFILLKTQHQFLTQCTLSVSYKSSLLLTSLLMALKMNHLELILLNCSGRWTFLFCICCVHYLSFCICVQICLSPYWDRFVGHSNKVHYRRTTHAPFAGGRSTAGLTNALKHYWGGGGGGL